jgi:hypothetical protein
MPSLITLPIRLPLMITARALKLGTDALRLLLADDEPEPQRHTATAPAAPPPPPPPPPEPSPPEPPHVDREEELAYSAGPADDPGATVHVDGEPFPGYDKLRANEVVARLMEADEATKAVVRFYEQQRKHRASILAATEA